MKPEAQPQNIENDWIANFFDKGKLISDDEMQNLWAKILAGEANKPRTYSKRTVNFLGSLDKSDAMLFQLLCGFCWSIAGQTTPLIYEWNVEIYDEHGIDFDSLKHLNEIGLISFISVLGSYTRERIPQKMEVLYFGKPTTIEFKNEKDNTLNIGRVDLSRVGQELAPICEAKPIPKFFDYVIDRWKKEGLNVLSVGINEAVIETPKNDEE